MADENTTEATAEAPTTTPDTGKTPDLSAEVEKWKALARKHEGTAKANKEAADRLAALEEANKSEAQKVAERLEAAERRALEAEATIVRQRVAIDYRLSPEDAGLLDAITDEAAMRAVAERLAKVDEKRSNGTHVPVEGGSPSPLALNGDPLEAALRNKLGIR